MHFVNHVVAVAVAAAMAVVVVLEKFHCSLKNVKTV
jgi:hypothetical protein